VTTMDRMRRRWLPCVTLISTLLVTAVARSDEDVAVPVQLQMELLVKVAAYDKNLASRAPDKVRLLILSKGDNAQSERIAQQAERALSGKTVANLPLQIESTAFADGQKLAGQVKQEGIDIVYVAPGLTGADLGSLARALEGVSVLSAGAVARSAREGVVLSFDLVGGKPKLLVHLKRARGQKVELSAQILKLVKVIE
jgi:hypothetical protein